MDELTKVVVGAAVGAVLGGGMALRLLIWALENRLRTTFATRADMNQLGSRVNALETVVVQARDAADEANARISVFEAKYEQQWLFITEKFSEQLVRPLEKVAATVEAIGAEQIRHSEALRYLYERANGKSQGGL